jgi:type II secretory pathway pseudopilin PulG
MSSRAEEKERRRREREEQEEAARRAASRRRAFQVGGGALAVIAVIAVVALLVLGGGGDDESTAADASAVREQAQAAGCTFREFRSEGRDHTNDPVDNYRTNPPTSGAHNPLPAQDGIYAPGNEPNKENWVHALEHGRIIFQYKPGTPRATVDRLRALAQEELEGSAGYHTLVMQNNTKMRPALAAVAWTRSLTCPRLDDASAEAMRSFRTAYTDKAPEFVP